MSICVSCYVQDYNEQEEYSRHACDARITVREFTYRYKASASTQDVESNFVSGKVCKHWGRGGVRGRGDTGRKSKIKSHTHPYMASASVRAAAIRGSASIAASTSTRASTSTTASALPIAMREKSLLSNLFLLSQQVVNCGYIAKY